MMGKKSLFRLMCMILVSLAILGASYGIYRQHQQTVEWYDIGTAKIPDSWTQTENSGFLMFCDQRGEPALVELVYTELTSFEDGSGTIRTIVDGIEEAGTIQFKRSALCSNSASYGVAQITVNGVTKEVRTIDAYGEDKDHADRIVYFYCSDDLSSFTIKQIAKSFRHS